MRLQTALNTVWYIGKCYAHAIRHGRAVFPPKVPKNVVVIQNSKLGDMVTTTPMFHAVKKIYPNCKVTVVGSASSQAVVWGNQDIDEYIVWKDDLPYLIDTFRKKNFDFGCFTSPSFNSLAALYLADIPSIAGPRVTNGWAPSQTVSYRLVMPLVIPKDHRMHSYVPGERLKLLEPMGIHTTDTKKYIFSTDAGKKRAEELLSKINAGGLRVGILAGAGNKIKEWFPERLAAVADYVIEKHHANVILIGTKVNRAEADALLLHAKNAERITDTIEQLTIDETIALIGKLGLLVGVDSGPMHFAEAQGTPTVAIAGNIDEHEHTPNDGKKHVAVVPKGRGKPQILTLNSRVYDYAVARRQMEMVSVEDVTSAIDAVVTMRKIQS